MLVHDDCVVSSLAVGGGATICGREAVCICRTYPHRSGGHLMTTRPGVSAARASGIHSVERTIEQGNLRMPAPGRKHAAADHAPPATAPEPDAPSGDDVDEASEESFPSSDPPERGGPSMAGRC